MGKLTYTDFEPAVQIDKIFVPPENARKTGILTGISDSLRRGSVDGVEVD